MLEIEQHILKFNNDKPKSKKLRMFNAAILIKYHVTKVFKNISKFIHKDKLSTKLK